MLIGLNGATTMSANLVTDIKAASQAGFDCLEIWAEKLNKFLATENTETLNSLFSSNKIIPVSINSIENITFQAENEFAKIKKECARLCKIAAVLKCQNIVVVPSPKPVGYIKESVKNESIKVLGELSEIAEKYQIRLAFEFLGFKECSVNTLADCLEIVESVHRGNIGLVLDTFHFFVGGSNLKTLERMNKDKLFIFHINDAQDLPRDQLKDANRLLPGDGIIPLRQILGALKKIGYAGIISVELFNPEYWQCDPNELAKEAKTKTDNILKKCFKI